MQAYCNSSYYFKQELQTEQRNHAMIEHCSMSLEDKHTLDPLRPN